MPEKTTSNIRIEMDANVYTLFAMIGTVRGLTRPDLVALAITEFVDNHKIEVIGAINETSG